MSLGSLKLDLPRTALSTKSKCVRCRLGPLFVLILCVEVCFFPDVGLRKGLCCKETFYLQSHTEKEELTGHCIYYKAFPLPFASWVTCASTHTWQQFRSPPSQTLITVNFFLNLCMCMHICVYMFWLVSLFEPSCWKLELGLLKKRAERHGSSLFIYLSSQARTCFFWAELWAARKRLGSFAALLFFKCGCYIH